MNGPVLFAYGFLEGGGVTAEDASASVKQGEPVWVHLDSNHIDTRAWLDEHIELDEHLVDALLDDETRPRAIRDEDAALVWLRGVNLNADSSPEDMVTLRVYADAKKIITMRGRKLMAATDVENLLKRTQKKVTSGSVLCSLIDHLLDRMAPVLESLDDTLDATEELVIEQGNADLRGEINLIRRQAILFRRYISPQRDAISQIRNLGCDWLNEIQHEQLIESHNHVQRYVEDLDAMRERAQIVKEELANILSERMNRNSFVLTVVAAIFLPISFLTGLLGINVAGIPGAENEAAFWIFSGILLVVVVLQIALFKKMKWF
ncbi:MAG: zinc transporter ZntB [Verrucomicrobiae bacterium]|nr:zinc transporter ZntB [Verrucomicrobiae bacterium]NNJ85894.1 zinc transporter ZntB [Akkermansiaceae bacterium]